jgi:hypothetical protein
VIPVAVQEELLDSRERQLLLLEPDLVCLRRELLGEPPNMVRECRREEDDLICLVAEICAEAATMDRE